MRYTIIIPVHNESLHVESQVSQFIDRMPSDLAEILQEIILVENGSSDGTLEACRRLELRFPNLVKVITISRGSYGEAIKAGMLKSSGTHLSILECDLLDSGFVVRSIALFHNNAADFIVGSKRHREAIDRRPFKRRALTAIYNVAFLRVCFGYPGTDTHGLKSIEGNCARLLCQSALTTDELFQTEIVLLAWRFNMQIEEVPIRIVEMRCPSVSIVRRFPKVLHAFRELKHSLKRYPVTGAAFQRSDAPTPDPISKPRMTVEEREGRHSEVETGVS